MFCEQIDKQTKIFLWQWHLMELEFANCLIMYSYRCCDKFFLYIFVFILLKILSHFWSSLFILFHLLSLEYNRKSAPVKLKAMQMISQVSMVLFWLYFFARTVYLISYLYCWLSHNVIKRIIDLISVYWEAWFWQQFLIHIVEF